MKTDTRDRILRMIDRSGEMRPLNLCEELKISPQAVHYHLRHLVRDGLIEPRRSVPFTRYAIAGNPSLEAVARWLSAPSLTQSPENVCATRDVFSARLPHLKTFVRSGLPEPVLPLVIAVVGEIGNNSFDHNAGRWRDVPGCWFESQVTGGLLWICIADRGQGIFQSLARVHPHLQNDQSALEAAFETIISGRAPEKRGNGLKFVRQEMTGTGGRGVACVSGKGRVQYGERAEKCAASLQKHFSEVKGTMTLMVWRLS